MSAYQSRLSARRRAFNRSSDSFASRVTRASTPLCRWPIPRAAAPASPRQPDGAHPARRPVVLPSRSNRLPVRGCSALCTLGSCFAEGWQAHVLAPPNTIPAVRLSINVHSAMIRLRWINLSYTPIEARRPPILTGRFNCLVASMRHENCTLLREPFARLWTEERKS
jgi:hypothetical protein